jgi:UDPglucose--hexose-1-phosphate uridylyltransferase
MSETRYDWLANRWVIFAPDRAKRPDEFVVRKSMEVDSHFVCPFCEGHEALTPEPSLTLPSPTRRSRNWLVRVVPNRYPAFSPLPPSLYRDSLDLNPTPDADERNERDHSSTSSNDVLFRKEVLHGAHEVVIESPEHAENWTGFGEAHVQHVFDAFRQRLHHWRAHDCLRYAVVFKNVGNEAGASLSHSHSQLIATEFVPPEIRDTCRRLQEYEDCYRRPYFEEVIKRELELGQRIILETKHFVALTPFASPVPYAVRILPKRRRTRFEEIDDDKLAEFSRLALRTMQGFESLLPGVSYNFVLHTSPFDSEHEDKFHWRMELFPRLTKQAGFEWGTNSFINPVLPEKAAVELRKALGAKPVRNQAAREITT